MKNSKLVVGHLMNDQLFVKSVTTSKNESFVEAVGEEYFSLFRATEDIQAGKNCFRLLTRWFSPIME